MPYGLENWALVPTPLLEPLLLPASVVVSPLLRSIFRMRLLLVSCDAAGTLSRENVRRATKILAVCGVTMHPLEMGRVGVCVGDVDAPSAAGRDAGMRARRVRQRAESPRPGRKRHPLV